MPSEQVDVVVPDSDGAGVRGVSLKPTTCMTEGLPGRNSARSAIGMVSEATSGTGSCWTCPTRTGADSGPIGTDVSRRRRPG